MAQSLQIAHVNAKDRNPAELEILRDMACARGQGYSGQPPGSAADLVRLLDQPDLNGHAAA